MKSKLALDLGTTTGFAIGGKGYVVSGIWKFKSSRFEGGGMRFLKFRRQLIELYAASPFDEVWYEEVRRHAGTDAAHIYGGLQAILTEFCEEHGIPYEGVPIGTIKANWTGKGNASKEAMVAEARRRGFLPIDDNEADALAIFHLKMQELDEASRAQQGKVQIAFRALSLADVT